MNEEEAKAIQEIAKTTHQGINALEKAGGYLSMLIGGSLEQAIGIFEDKLKYSRWERKIRLLDRANEFLKNRSINCPTIPVPLKLVIPILEAGSIEDDDEIQDIYAQILANSADKSFKLTIKRTYIDVLQNLSGLEIDILRKLYSFNFEDIWNIGVWTTNFPSLELTQPSQCENLRPPKDIEIALANMFRLGLINRESTYNGCEIYSLVKPTLFGKEFVQICGIA
ncbi:Abi-alpha family protein [Methylomonas sp. 2BW1-5-20]|uniref:Abi-alpha family protein n=1 Tax=Methylomonas sp. 2BW1-5-20 TaxID=3376686 RepID=UPI0040518FDA